MKFFAATLSLLLIPSHAFAAEVAFRLIEEVYASSPVETGTSDDNAGNLTGRQAREYRERLMDSYESEQSDEDDTSSSAGLLEQHMASDTVPVNEAAQTSSVVSISSESSASSESSEVSVSSISSVRTYAPTTLEQQEEQDRLTLEQLDEYRDEAYANQEEQMELLEEGFSITSTSSLGAALSSNQRAAILRRNVRTVPQLKLFARALAESDENLRKIEVSMNGIRMSYRRKAWLFGFIPLNYILDVSVEDGVVSAPQPWWHTLSRDGVKDDVETLQQQLTSEDKNEDEAELLQTLDGMKTALRAIASFLRSGGIEQ